MATRERFDGGIGAWLDWQEAPWGRLRYLLAEANLDRHLTQLKDGPLRVLDVAGGNGVEAVRLARRGHHVTVVDFSPEMLAAADIAAEAAGVADRVAIVTGALADLPLLVEPAAFDLVLCHNLLQYTDDAAGTIRAVLGPLRPGGLLSLISVNPDSDPLRAALHDGDPAAALAALDTAAGHAPLFDTPIQRYPAERIKQLLARAGAPVVGHYGIRAVCDYMTQDEKKNDPQFFADLESLERALSDRLPYLLTARFYHLIAGRSPLAQGTR